MASSTFVPRATARYGSFISVARRLKWAAAMTLLAAPCSQTNTIVDALTSGCVDADCANAAEAISRRERTFMDCAPLAVYRYAACYHCILNPKAQIAVLDAGGQYCHLIARKVRDLGVYAEVRASETPAAELASARGIIISGGPSSVYDPGSPTVDPAIFDLEIGRASCRERQDIALD